MPTIRQLPTSIINKIAAGEVIERPASVVKEMLENSVDAGSTRIELSVEKGGVDLIRIADNGCGIDSDQLLLAIAPHATSKLQTADDLFDVHTLGFRGEALASIAEISHLIIRSRPLEAQSGAEIVVRGGTQEGPAPCAAPQGTTIEVRHLFFNTPVRRKFLKSPQTEMGHVTEQFTRIALAFPQIHMILNSGDRTVYDLPPCERWSERIRVFFGDEVGDALIPVDNQDGEIHLRGYVADPSVSRSNNRLQYLFLNGRCIRDRSLQHALSEAYRGLLMVGRFPICFLRLDMPTGEVDVNVHPTKSEVRFADGGRIYGQMLRTIRHKFLSTDLTARVGSPTPSPAAEPTPWDGSSTTSSLPPAEARPIQTPNGLLQWSKADTAEFKPFPNIGPSFRSNDAIPAPRPSGSSFSRDPFQMVPPPSREPGPVGMPWQASSPVDASAATLERHENEEIIPSAMTSMASTAEPTSMTTPSHVRIDTHAMMTPQGSHLGFQIHNRYLVTEDENGMVVVDQHALHERIMYEQIREKVLSKQLESQRLLVPEPVTLTAAEAAMVIQSAPLLKEIGIEVEPFGGDTVLITAYPAMLSNISPSEMLRQILDPMMNSGKNPDPRDLLDSLLHMISCKAAIKAGDRLTSEEITSLLEQRHLFADTHHCPHGRPTALFFSRDQLDKMFKRI